jgi:subtilisin family serine protease
MSPNACADTDIAPTAVGHSGILTTHVEFGGRAEWGANFGDSIDGDCNGHGTHVAGIVAGHTYGVAKNATVIAVRAPIHPLHSVMAHASELTTALSSRLQVKVFSCAGAGSWDAVISGLQWTADRARKRGRPAVANMSLSGGKSPTTNAAAAGTHVHAFVPCCCARNSLTLAWLSHSGRGSRRDDRCGSGKRVL